MRIRHRKDIIRLLIRPDGECENLNRFGPTESMYIRLAEVGRGCPAGRGRWMLWMVRSDAVYEFTGVKRSTSAKSKI